MRLYAKVKSDRASKGQGGNKYIDIELHAFDRTDIVGRVLLQIKKDKKGEDNQYIILFQDPEDPPVRTIVLKEGHAIDGVIRPTPTEKAKGEKAKKDNGEAE